LQQPKTVFLNQPERNINRQEQKLARIIAINFIYQLLLRTVRGQNELKKVSQGQFQLSTLKLMRSKE